MLSEFTSGFVLGVIVSAVGLVALAFALAWVTSPRE